MKRKAIPAQRISLYVPANDADLFKIEMLAKAENRPVSSMLRILLSEALEARKCKR